MQEDKEGTRGSREKGSCHLGRKQAGDDAHRAAGGDRHYRHSRGPAFACCADGPGVCPAGTVRRGLGLVPDGVGNDYKSNWGSPHPGGVQFLLADGRSILIRTRLPS